MDRQDLLDAVNYILEDIPDEELLKTYYLLFFLYRTETGHKT